MKCLKCNSKLKKVEVEVEDASSKAISYQCPNCEYFTFEPQSAIEVIREIKEKEAPLKIKQKIIKLSKLLVSSKARYCLWFVSSTRKFQSKSWTIIGKQSLSNMTMNS